MKAFTAFLAMAAAVNAHMILRTPTPANNPDSSPLSADGSNYPCKMPGGSGQLDKSKPNVMAIGSSQSLALTGGATHGGGSCQVSLAKGTTISKDMKFMVIHSIEGGCPIGGVDGNLNADASSQATPSFPFTIPDHPDLTAGDYTLAWTWNNKIGNREFYMNCAYVQLQGATKKRYEPSKPAISRRDQAPLPDLFVANIGNGCTVPEGIDVVYPDPGSSVVKGQGANLQPPSGNCGTVNAANQGSASTAAATAGGAATSAASTAMASNSVKPISSSAANNGQYTQSQGGNFATVGASSAAASSVTAAASAVASTAPAVVSSAAATTTAASAVVASASASVSAATSAVASASTGTSSIAVGLQSGPCTNEGAWACAADGKSFQRCASGAWSVSMPVSAGMTCVPGISANFSYNLAGANAKRDLRSHIARKRHGLNGATAI